MVDKVQNALDEGNNFAEAAAAAKIPVSTTPLLTQSGAARADPGYKLPAEFIEEAQSGQALGYGVGGQLQRMNGAA